MVLFYHESPLKMHKHLVTLLSLAMVLIPVACSREADRQLDDVASYIEARPDSALAVLRGMPQMPTRKTVARQALLHSMAIDKCYIDLTTDSLLAPAVAYYSKRGNPDDRLKMYYYKGRLMENVGDREAALEWYVKGERFVPKCKDLSAVGRLYTGKSTQYYRRYLHTAAMVNDSLALAYYCLAGDRHRSIMAREDLAIDYILLRQHEKLDTLLASLEMEIPFMTAEQLAIFSQHHLTLALCSTGEYEKALSLVYKNIPSPKDYPVMEVLRSYNALHNRDSASFYRQRLERERSNYRNVDAYYMATSDALALEGDFEAAYRNMRNYVNVELGRYYPMLQSEINYIEEKTQNEYDGNISKLKYAIISISLLLLLLVAMASLLIVRDRLKKKSEEASILQERYSTVLSEKDMLESMAESSSTLSPEMQEMLAERVRKIEDVLVMRKSKSKSEQAAAIEELDSLVENKKSFILTLSLLYAVCHPDFMKTLKEKNLTDTEIGYCCLYSMNMSVKDVADLLDTSRAYPTNADIRKKLGLSGSSISLPEYLESLM